MAIIYIDSTATGAADGTSWTDAFVTLNAGLAVWTTSDEVWMEKDHSESSGSSPSYTAVNTDWQITCEIYRMDKATDTYDSTGTTDNLITTNIVGMYVDEGLAFHGVNFKSGGAFRVSASDPYFEDCNIKIGLSGSGGQLYAQSTQTIAMFKNCHIDGTATTAATIWAAYQGYMRFVGCTFAMTSASTGLIEGLGYLSGNTTVLEFIDCDLENLDFPTLVKGSTITNNAIVVTSATGTVLFQNCKLPTNYVLAIQSDINTNRGSHITVEGCNDGTPGYKNEFMGYVGSVSTDTAVYFNTGYQDYESNTRLSQVMMPHSTITRGMDLQSFQIAGVLSSTGSKTFTLELLENYTVALTERDIWVDISYLGSATSPHHSVDTSTKEYAKGTAYTALSAGSGLGLWTGEPAGSRSVKLEATVTVNKPGLYYATVHVNKYESGKVVHIDPLLVVT